MAVDPDSIDALPDYTAAQRLKMVRHAIMNILAAGQSYTVEERSKMSAQLAELRKMEKELETEVAADDQTISDGVIEFGRE